MTGDSILRKRIVRFLFPGNAIVGLFPREVKSSCPLLCTMPGSVTVTGQHQTYTCEIISYVTYCSTITPV